MATAKRLSPTGPSDPEIGIRVLSPTPKPVKEPSPVSIEVKQEKEEPSGQEVLLRNLFRRSPALGFGRRRHKTSKKGRKSRKTRRRH